MDHKGVVGAVEALTHPPKAVQRLLKMAVKWSDARFTATSSPAVVRSARQLTPGEIDQLVASYQAKATVRQLADQFGIHRATVGRHLEARGIDTRQLLLAPHEIQEAAKQYLKGSTLEKVATTYQVGSATIRRLLLDYGTVLRPRGRQK